MSPCCPSLRRPPISTVCAALLLAMSQAASNRLPPMMSPNEAALFEQHVSKAGVYMEYGCGGSTMLACKSGAGEVFSVDSHPLWIAQVRDAARSCPINVTMMHVDVGPVRTFGFPVNTNLTASREYASAISSVPRPHVDFVLIDGRWRVSSFFFAYSALLVDNTTLFGFHGGQAAGVVVGQRPAGVGAATIVGWGWALREHPLMHPYVCIACHPQTFGIGPGTMWSCRLWTWSGVKGRSLF